MQLADQVELFLQSSAFAVVGASSNRAKYGNKVLRCYLQHGRVVYPVNLREEVIESIPVVHTIDELPNEVRSISIITPPIITEKIVTDAIKKGIKNIWIQPGAESDRAIRKCVVHSMNIIFGGPCILAIMGFNNSQTVTIAHPERRSSGRKRTTD